MHSLRERVNASATVVGEVVTGGVVCCIVVAAEAVASAWHRVLLLRIHFRAICTCACVSVRALCVCVRVCVRVVCVCVCLSVRCVCLCGRGRGLSFPPAPKSWACLFAGCFSATGLQGGGGSSS